MRIATVTLYRSGEHLIANEADEARFAAEGWKRSQADGKADPVETAKPKPKPKK